MTIDKPATPEELAALLEIALGVSSRKIPAITLAKLVALRYIAMTENGLDVTGEGLIRLTQSQSDGSQDPA